MAAQKEVHLFDESMLVMECVLQEYNPNMNMTYVRKQIGDDLYEEFLVKNEEDMRLYNIATSLLGERFSCVGVHNDLLKDFSGRDVKAVTEGKA